MIRDKLTEDMKAAMKSGDKVRLSTVRMLISELKNERIAQGKDLDDASERRVLSVRNRGATTPGGMDRRAEPSACLRRGTSPNAGRIAPPPGESGRQAAEPPSPDRTGFVRLLHKSALIDALSVRSRPDPA